MVALRHRFGLDIEEAPYKTPSGFIVGQLGREAVVGDERALVDQAIRRRSPSRVRQWCVGEAPGAEVRDDLPDPRQLLGQQEESRKGRSRTSAKR